MRDYKLRKRVYNSFVDGEKLEKKTSAMTTPVGVDEEGKLWTSGGGGGGGGGGSLVCRILEGTTPENTRLDTQWAVVNQAFVTGKAVIIRVDQNDYSIWSRVVTTTAQPNEFTIVVLDDEGSPAYLDTNSPDGYPKFRET